MNVLPRYSLLRFRWLIFWILAFGYVAVYFHRLCPAVVAEDMRRDLAAGGGLLGLLGSAYFYPYALMQLPAGLLSDSWGPRKTITLFFFIAFAGSVTMGMASNAYMAIAGRTLVGLGVAMLFVPALKVLSEWFRVREFAFMTGILMAMGGIGSYSAAAPLAYISNWIGWRRSFALVGGFTLALAVLVWIFVRDRPSDMGLSKPDEPESRQPEHTLGKKGNMLRVGRSDGETPRSIRDNSEMLHPNRIEYDTPRPIRGLKIVLSHPRFWPLAGWFFFTCAIFFSFIGLWGGPYLMQIYGLGKTEAGHILSMAAVGMIVGSPLLSFFSNNLFKGRKPVLVLSSVFLTAAAGALFFFPRGIAKPFLYLICLAIGTFAGASVTVGFTANKEMFPLPIAGTASGLINFFPFFGGAVFQVVLGAVLDSQGLTTSGGFSLQGFRYALLVLFICGVSAFLSSLFVEETMKTSYDTHRYTSEGGRA
jgi:sugar phosphate permease